MRRPDFSKFSERLPQIIARDKVEELLGGIISAKTLANKDWEGTGPSGRIRVGRKIAYRTEDLLMWLSERSTSLN